MNISTSVTVLAFFAFLIFIGPVFSIMALNTLFGLGIDLTMKTWFAMWWIHLFFALNAVKK